MVAFDRGKRRLFLLLTIVAFFVLLTNISLLSGTDVRATIKNIPIPGQEKNTGQNAPPDPNHPKTPSESDPGNFEDHAAVNDNHPIVGYMKEADERWQTYEDERSMTFKETVSKYRRDYGRNPPPGFRDWYKFARDRNVHNIDDFAQIMDDLRPFWGVEPAVIRSLAAHMHEDKDNGISGIFIRDGKIWNMTNTSWRTKTLAEMLKPFVGKLPDMDIAMNRLDQPRVVVPWDDLQALLKKEATTRQIYPDAAAEWTTNMTGFWKVGDPDPTITDPNFFPAHGKQYMEIAKEGCPPESHAKDKDPEDSLSSAEALYKDSNGGFVINFNRSSDLCTIGPEIEDKHGFLFAPSSIVASKSLLPIFGECKVNVNNDILFPANMYYMDDDRYSYDETSDFPWDDKKEAMIWRGVTSGGVNTADNWEKMHRQRLVRLLNATVIADQDVRIMNEDPDHRGNYRNFNHFNASKFALDHSDVGFTETMSCVPDCSFYDGIWTYKNMMTLSEQFRSKYVIDVDGHSFSGRWRAFLQSRSLGIKSTIFREWHDSRLIPWRHFVPLDNRFDEIYSLLTYFIGLGSPSDAGNSNIPYVPRHDFEARKLGRQGREWAAKVLRKEDIEIYLYRLMIEYARIIDDHRDRIGYSGDGSELDKFDADKGVSLSNGGINPGHDGSAGHA